MSDFEPNHQPKLISRKIWMAGKLLKLQIVYAILDFAIELENFKDFKVQLNNAAT